MREKYSNSGGKPFNCDDELPFKWAPEKKDSRQAKRKVTFAEDRVISIEGRSGAERTIGPEARMTCGDGGGKGGKWRTQGTYDFRLTSGIGKHAKGKRHQKWRISD